LGEHKFKISVTWINSTVFPPISLPVGVPTSKEIKVTITSVCQLENMITPNAALPITSGASKINQAVIADMTWKIQFNALASTVNNFTPFKDVYNNFCGEIEYSLKYVTGKPNVKDLSLVTLDKVNTKLTISPDLLQTKGPPFEVYDHSYYGEHELVLEVSWIQSQAFPTYVALPANHPV